MSVIKIAFKCYYKLNVTIKSLYVYIDLTRALCHLTYTPMPCLNGTFIKRTKHLSFQRSLNAVTNFLLFLARRLEPSWTVPYAVWSDTYTQCYVSLLISERVKFKKNVCTVFILLFSANYSEKKYYYFMEIPLRCQTVFIVDSQKMHRGSHVNFPLLILDFNQVWKARYMFMKCPNASSQQSEQQNAQHCCLDIYLISYNILLHVSILEG
jgi:hypothetical protein